MAKLLATSAVLALALSACLPFPPVIRGPEPTRNVFMPGVAESGPALSPLRPTSPAPGAPTAAPATLAPAAVAPRAAPPLQGPVWQWTASRFVDGTTLAPADPARYTLEFLPDGNALVQADCNFGTGLYKEDADRLTFGAIGATKMACPADSLDSAFLAQLGKVERYLMEGEALALMLQEAAGEMRLVAQPGTLPPTPTPTASPTPLPPPTATPTLAPTMTASPRPTVAPPSPTPFIPTPGLPSTPTTVKALETAFNRAITHVNASLTGL